MDPLFISQSLSFFMGGLSAIAFVVASSVRY